MQPWTIYLTISHVFDLNKRPEFGHRSIGCIGNDLRRLSTLKRLLGVRSSTNTEIALLEAGVPTPKDYIKHKQHEFLHKLTARDGFWDSYIGKSVSMALQYKSDSGKILKTLLKSPDHNYISASMLRLKNNVQSNTSTRHVTYKLMNPSLEVNYIYSQYASVPEFQRIAFTRLRLMSHRLRIETGRWTRPKTPLERRSCKCKDIESEQHVLLECPLSVHLRNPYINGYSDISSLFELTKDSAFVVSKLCFKALEVFK